MNKYKYIALILVTTFVMGVAFPVGKVGMAYATPFFLMGIRFVLAGGILAVIVWKKSRPVGWMWGKAALIGLFQSAGVMGCAYYSMNWITSGESSIITCTNPLLVIVLGTFLTGAKYRGRQWIGVALGFIGVLITFGLQMNFQAGMLIGFAGAIFFAASTLLIKRWGVEFDMTVLAAYQMLAGGIALLLLSAVTEHPYFTFTSTSVAVVLWLVILGSIVQFSLWFYLLRSGDPAKTSAFLFLVPVFGLLSSWLLLGEKVAWYVGLGGAFICVGIFLVNWEGKARSEGRLARVR
ncbi:DMT family transporter [Paenibacillus aceris]|uniref:Drug/metabolite transporter (DMT)-like permease n=1 Tax=Paenibacillus aceris TaxID=869555 RepID=A0ABS4HYG6_9BACL|nr:DMT family transporter [Paenibacillus aceris]MBP1963600.1 drug/metabolite transporter (DMT)-like permease [Paenibacillus aceris]NHW36861.1 DMT family transporter [Paenibacillus aceris]